jgi:hypothetical protein
MREDLLPAPCGLAAEPVEVDTDVLVAVGEAVEGRREHSGPDSSLEVSRRMLDQRFAVKVPGKVG